MNPNLNPNEMEEFSEVTELDDLTSINDFIKELEAREKDLHISPEMVIEIESSEAEESEFADKPAPEARIAETVVVEENSKKAPMPEKMDDQKVSQLQQELSKLESQILKMESERSELFELSRRRQSDFDNYKKRTERDRTDTFNNQLGNLANQILPVIDNLGRAIDSAANLAGEKPADFQQFYDGIALVSKQLNEVMKEMGVEPIKSVGEIFDPHFHEAVETDESADVPPNTIVGELLRGYKIGDRIIRAAMVKVSTAADSNGVVAGISEPQ